MQKEDEKSDTKLGTLIVVPPNLLAQWQDETDVCCPELRVTRYHSSKHNRVRMSDLHRADIVLTSYHEVTKAYPSKERMKAYEELPEAEKAQKFEEALGWLFKVEWHRIILDEGHCIKNSSTHTFTACNYLQGKNRWALTATPVHNGVHEVYPYAKFIREPNAEVFKDARHKNSGRRAEAKRLMELFLKEVCLNRKIDDLFLGKAMFKLPPGNPLPNIWITLSEEEFFIYKYVEKRIRRMINERLNEHMDGEERKKCKASFFTLAIRLRQAVTHPFLLFLMLRDMFELEDIRLIRETLQEIKKKHPDRPFNEQIGSWWEEKLQGQLVGEVGEFSQEGPQGTGDHGLEFNMETHFQKLEKLKTHGAKICNICFEPLRTPRVTSCGHVFCRECLIPLLEEARNDRKDKIECPTCDTEHPLDVFLKSNGAQASSQTQSRRGRARRQKGWNHDMPGNDSMGYQPMGDEEAAAFLEECDKNVTLPLTPSAKTTVVKDVIVKWQKEHPQDKIIVFTQWVLLGRILGRVLEQETINFLYYFGEMTREEKEDNVKAFHDVPQIKVMIASLKCGGQGLNLTCANRVILIDPWWNSALEHQGYGRVFRMGQTKETYFVRLLTRHTIDGRMACLQSKKLREIAEVLKPFDTLREMPKFREVIELFGRVESGENGKLVVVDDYDSDDDASREGGAAIPGPRAPNAGDSGGAAAENVGGENEIDDILPGYGDSVIGGYGIQDLI